jgi:hypothetical protein
MTIRYPGAAAAALALWTAACAPADPPAHVETYEARVLVRPAGGVDVHEALAIGTDAGSFRRIVAIAHADAITFVAASIDGRPLAPGTGGAPGLRVADGRTLDVRWAFTASAGATHALTLDYRLDRAVEISGARGRVELRLLDAPRAFDVGEARLSLLPPPGVALYANSGIAEAGWTVAHAEGGIRGERRGVGRGDTATLVAALPIDPSIMADPVWQTNLARADQFAAAFVSGGLFIVVVGSGVLWIVRLQHPRGQRGDEDERRIVRRGLRRGGAACIVLSIAAGAATALTLASFGPAAMAVPASILIVGVAFVAASPWLV